MNKKIGKLFQVFTIFAAILLFMVPSIPAIVGGDESFCEFTFKN